MARDLKAVFSAMGARLAIARNEVGLTQTAMADAIGVSHRAYHSYEKGQRGLPVEALVAIADKFDVDLPQSLVDYRERNKQRDAVNKAMSAEGLL